MYLHSYELQDLKNTGKRIVVETHDPCRHAAALKAPAAFGASPMKRIAQAEYDAIFKDFKSTWQDCYGDRPEWKGPAMLAEYGTRLFSFPT